MVSVKRDAMVLMNCSVSRSEKEGQILYEIKQYEELIVALERAGTEIFSFWFKHAVAKLRLGFCAASNCAFDTIAIQLWLK